MRSRSRSFFVRLLGIWSWRNTDFPIETEIVRWSGYILKIIIVPAYNWALNTKQSLRNTCYVMLVVVNSLRHYRIWTTIIWWITFRKMTSEFHFFWTPVLRHEFWKINNIIKIYNFFHLNYLHITIGYFMYFNALEV